MGILPGWRDLAVNHAKLTDVYRCTGGRDRAAAALREGKAIKERITKL